jgi:hypothetical protein
VRKCLKLPKGVHKKDEEIREGIKNRMRAKHVGR